MKFKTGRTKLRYLRLYAQQKHGAKHIEEVDYKKAKHLIRKGPDRASGNSSVPISLLGGSFTYKILLENQTIFI